MASVLDSEGEQNSSIVGDGGMVYLSGLPPKGELRVRWGRQADQQCRVSYALDDAPVQETPTVNIVQRSVICR